MGNILDSDKEEKETMEGEEGITKDQSEQTPSGEANGETPVIDMKETIILNEDGTEVLINGENGEQDPNESLDTQTQTREEEFPPDDVPPVQDPSIGGGMGDLPGKEPDLVNGDLEAEDQEEEQREITTEASEEEAIVNGQEDVPSEEHAIPDKPLGIQENGTDEKTGTKDEEIPSPREQELVSTDPVVGSPNNVELVNVDIHHHHVEESTTSVDTSASQGGSEVCTDHDTGTEHAGLVGNSTLEPYTEQTQSNDKHAIPDTSTKQTHNTDTCSNESDKYIQDITKGQEGLADSIHSQHSFTHNKEDQVISGEEETTTSIEKADTDIADEGRHAVIESSQAKLEESLLVEQECQQPQWEEAKGSVGCQSDLETALPQKEVEVMSLKDRDNIELNNQEALIDSKVNVNFGERLVVEPSSKDQGEEKYGEEVADIKAGSNDISEDIYEECDSNLESDDIGTDINENLSGKDIPAESEEEKLNVVNYVDDVVNRAMEQYISLKDDSLPEQESNVGGETQKGIGLQEIETEQLSSADGDQGLKLEQEGLEPKDEIKQSDQEIGQDTQIENNIGKDENKVDLEVVTQEQLTVEATPHTGETDESKTEYLEGDTAIIDSEKGNLPEVAPENVAVTATMEDPSSKQSTGDNDESKIEFLDRDSAITDSETGNLPQVSLENIAATEDPSLKESQGLETWNKRWSAPVGMSTEETSEPKFRPVKFRPSSTSKDSKWRRTSLGVPRGWKAAPVDLLPPSSETDSLPSQLDSHEGFTKAPNDPELESVLDEPPRSPSQDSGIPTSPRTSEISSLSSSSLQSSVSGDAPSGDKNLFRAEPVMVSDEVGDPVHYPVSYPSDISGTSVSSSPISHIPQGTVTTAHDPVSPTAKNIESKKRTPPLSQKVPVYEMKEPPTPPTGGAQGRRQAFGQDRSMTTGDLPKKLSKAEEERQQVFAALRVKRPMKSKWQGQIELEEKEHKSAIIEEGKSVDSARLYEERKKEQMKSKSFDIGGSSVMSEARPIKSPEFGEGREARRHSSGDSGGPRPHSLTIDGGPEESVDIDIPRDEVLSPNGDTCSSGYTSGRSTPAGEDASRNLSLPKASNPGVSMYKEYQSLLKEEDHLDQSAPINEETGLRSTVSREPGESYVKSAVKLREKKGSKVNSHVVKQNRISFVEQEVLRAKQKEEEFKREREMRSQELQHHGKAPVPPPTGNSRLQSPTSPEPPAVKPAPTKPTPAKPVNRPSNSKAKAVYQELNYNPKTGGGNRSTAMVRDWESKFKK